MAREERIVRRLRLRARDESGIHRATTLFEDAIRTAGLPGSGARWVLVRRLALGRIETDSAQSLALQLERQVEALHAGCPHGAEESANAAPAVWFGDALDAHLQLALRVARGTACDAWYWRLAVPGWRPRSPVPEALRAIVLSLASRAEAPAALPALVAGLVADGHAPQLVAGLGANDVPVLLRAAGLSAAALQRDDSKTIGSRDQAPTNDGRSALTTTARSLERESPWSDSRGRLIAALLAVASRRFAPAVSSAAGVGGSSPASTRAGRPEPHRRPAARSSRSGGDRSPRPETPQDSDRNALAERTRSPVETVHGIRPPPSAADDRKGDVRLPSAESDFALQASSAAGLLFLLNVLARLGYAEWIETWPEWEPFDPARHVLALALRRLALDADDPAHQLVRIPRTAAQVPSGFVAPAIWLPALSRGPGPLKRSEGRPGGALYDPSERLLLGAWRGDVPEALRSLRDDAQSSSPARDKPHHFAALPELVALSWLSAARRWLRRHAGIGVADVVLRPGALSTTPTHADVFFDHSQAELRLRRAGLDLDPGWLPWFGRVISFHYERRETS